MVTISSRRYVVQRSMAVWTICQLQVVIIAMCTVSKNELLGVMVEHYHRVIVATADVQ